MGSKLWHGRGDARDHGENGLLTDQGRPKAGDEFVSTARTVS
jgi:hypothetical protein